MVLFNCPDCENRISDKALFCPSCGYRTRLGDDKINQDIVPVPNALPADEFSTCEVLEISKIFTALIPVVGGSISEAIGYWLSKQGKDKALLFQQELESNLKQFKNFTENQCSIIFEMTKEAIVTGDEDKFRYLRNAAVNFVLEDVKDVKRIIFMDLIKRYSSAHIRILNEFAEYPYPYDFFEGRKKGHFNLKDVSLALDEITLPDLSMDILENSVITLINDCLLIDRSKAVTDYNRKSYSILFLSRTGIEFLHYLKDTEE